MRPLDTETSTASLDAWHELEESGPSEVQSLLESLENVPTSVHVAVLACRKLGFDRDHIPMNAPKLHARPLSKVYRFVLACEGEPMEQRQGLLTQFAKDVKPVGGEPGEAA